MPAKLTFHPLGNADCTRIDLANGKKVLIDYADMRNPDDSTDRRCDLPEELRNDLRAVRRDYFDVVCFTHLDNDHCGGVGEFFWLEHAAKYQEKDRIKIRELWVPAAAILEDGCEDSARLVRQEARHRLKKGEGIRVFSRPEKLKEWLKANGLSLESRNHLITDAGNLVPGYALTGPERVQFFIHSPFGWRQDEKEIVDRNQDSVVFQATFLEGERETHALFMSDIDHESIEQIVTTTKRHKREDRLLWDVFKIAHHCSYTAVGPEKGEDETKPTDEVRWLCEIQGRERSTIMSTSWSIPVKGSAADKDVQPPHRQAAAYYRRVATVKDGQFKVTMDLPSASKPKPSTIEITDRGARLLSVSAAVGVASIVSTPARAG
jgi:ribonuclease BN (tRNA processing enzyme)